MEEREEMLKLMMGASETGGQTNGPFVTARATILMLDKIDDLNESIRKHSESTDKLGRKMYLLNIAVAAGTVCVGLDALAKIVKLFTQ